MKFYQPVLRKPIHCRRVSSELKDHYSLLLNVIIVYIKRQHYSWVILSVLNIVTRATVTMAI